MEGEEQEEYVDGGEKQQEYVDGGEEQEEDVDGGEEQEEGVDGREEQQKEEVTVVKHMLNNDVHVTQNHIKLNGQGYSRML